MNPARYFRMKVLKIRRSAIMKIWKFSASGLLRGAVAAALAGAVVLGLGLPAQAGLLGDEVTLESIFDASVCPDGTPCMDTVTVVAGIEFTAGDGTGIGTAMANIPTPGSFIDIGDSSITFVIMLTTDWAGTFTLQGMDWLPDAGTVTGVELDASSDPGISLTPDILIAGPPGSEVEMQLSCPPVTCASVGNTYIVNFITDHTGGGGDPVPEPSSIMLFGAGLGMLGLMVMTRRRRQAA